MINANDLLVEVTDICNLKCLHCDYDTNCDRTFISRATFDNIFKVINPDYLFRITISGGEPLLHPNIIDLIKRASSFGAAIRVNTNGILLDWNFLEKIKDIKKLEFRISLYGNRRTHNLITGADCYDKITKNIDFALNSLVNISVNCPVFKYNYKECLEVQKYCDEKKIICHFDYLITSCKSKKSLTHIRLTDKELEMLFKQNRIEVPANRKCSSSIRCTAGVSLFAVNYRGELFPCGLCRLALGNVNSTSITDITNNISSFTNKVRIPSLCKECDLNSICNKCMAISLTESNDINMIPREVCRINGYRYKIR